MYRIFLGSDVTVYKAINNKLNVVNNEQLKMCSAGRHSQILIFKSEKICSYFEKFMKDTVFAYQYLLVLQIFLLDDLLFFMHFEVRRLQKVYTAKILQNCEAKRLISFKIIIDIEGNKC